jgi:hypothetical protein
VSPVFLFFCKALHTLFNCLDDLPMMTVTNYFHLLPPPLYLSRSPRRLMSLFFSVCVFVYVCPVGWPFAPSRIFFLSHPIKFPSRRELEQRHQQSTVTKSENLLLRISFSLPPSTLLVVLLHSIWFCRHCLPRLASAVIVAA